MIIYPAVDISGGKCVRLLRGDLQERTVYGDPVDIARNWEAQGAQWIHVVDLDGAFSGNAANLRIVREIVRAVHIPVQLGGGIRSQEAVTDRLESIGVQRVVLGTAAVDNPDLVRWAARRYTDQIAAGIDARNGLVAVHGWTEQTDVTAAGLALRMFDAGVKTVVYTDISRDGMMAGANYEATAALVSRTPCQVIGSGGISALADIRQMAAAGAAGCIVGKALLSGAFTLQEAMEAAGC